MAVKNPETFASEFLAADVVEISLSLEISAKGIRSMNQILRLTCAGVNSEKKLAVLGVQTH